MSVIVVLVIMLCFSHSGQTYPGEWEHRYGPLGCMPRVTCQEETTVPPQVPIYIPFPVLVTQINNYGGTNSFNINSERPKAKEQWPAINMHYTSSSPQTFFPNSKMPTLLTCVTTASQTSPLNGRNTTAVYLTG
ncbi:hypothetical protein RvY_18140-2 [Ramazzottius varieornatus]|uniref:Uncharacterized protein n=1 Tax=Ramazzottius varieornatus TaxID=947166 RepID=A0A1D1W593_RAMVA|nr:hypothetical protein RvY_18140-2 [Ramazzottius varieornatus]